MVGDAFKYYTHATNNKQWYDSTKAIYAEYEIGYQPLLLLRTPVVPFDETFPGTYLSRMHHTYELYASGFSFLVHSTAFAVTIDAGVASRIQADVDLTGQWLVPGHVGDNLLIELKKNMMAFLPNHVGCQKRSGQVLMRIWIEVHKRLRKYILIILFKKEKVFERVYKYTRNTFLNTL